MRGKTNKFLGILLALAMLLTSVLPSMSALAAGAAEVTLVSSAADALKPGDTFTVTPTIANNPGFAGATWKLEYDNTALELTGITADGRKAGHLFGYGTFVSNVNYGNNNLVYANATPETEDGALCELTFKVRDNAAAGDYTVNVAKSDADFKFVALNSVNVDVNFTAANVKVAGNQSEYADAYLAYCKGTAGAYEFLPVGETLYINNYAKADGAKELIAEYKLAVVNNGEIVSEMSEDKWTVEGNVFKIAAHNASDPDGVLTVNATGKSEDAEGTLTAALPDGTALSTNVHVTKTPWKITANGVDGLSKDQYRSANSSVYAFINDSFKFTYVLQTATNSSIKGTNVKLSFASSNAKVATVAEDGTITAIGEGSTQISVKAVAYNYGVPTEIELLNTLNVYVDKGFVTNFVLTDADGNVRTENIKNASGYTVPQLTMNAGEEITLNVKAMPGMTDAECAGTIASQKQFTVSTNKTALTATTVDTNTVTLKAADVTADTTVTVRSPQYYRSKASSANLWAEQFTLTVNIKAPSGVESVALDKTSMNLVLCDGFNTGKLTAAVNPENVDQSVVWSTDNAEVATVSEDGTVTAVAVGTAHITAKSTLDETKTATCEVTVTEEVKLTSVNWTIDTVNSEIPRVNKNSSAYVYVVDKDADVGKKIVMKATYKPDNATNKTLKAIEWSLKGTNIDTIASIDEYGTVTWNGGFGKAELNGKGPYNGTTTTRVQTLHFTPGLATAAKVMKDGEEVTETIVVKPGDTITFNAAWDVTNEAYAPEYQWVRLNGDGSDNNKFTNLTANGDLVITSDKLEGWKIADGGEITLQLRVAIYQSALKNSTSDTDTVKKSFVVKYEKTAAVESVSLSESALALNEKETATLTATVSPAEANQSVVWSTSNSEVATVENGVVTAVAAGTATIKATSASDETKFAECEVTVTAKPDYSNAYLAYCKGSKTAYEFIPVGDTLHINNWANGQTSVQEYRIAVVNNGEIVADMPNEKWSIENKANIFMNAYHNSSDPDGVFYINAHGKTDGATGSITATLPDGSTLTTNVVVTETPSDIVVTGVTGIGKSQYNSKTAYANIDEAFKFTYTYKNSSNNKVNAANTKFTFESADPAVATVAEDGTITAKGEGSTTITVYALTYYYGEITPVAMKTALSVTVDQNYVKYFAVADTEGNLQGTYAENAYGYVQPTITLNAGEEITLFAKGMPGMTEPAYSSTTKTFKLQSGSGITVTNNDDGSFTLKADDVTEETTATVRSPGFYRSAANKKAASSFDTNVVIKPAAAVESVTVNPTAVELKEGETATLTATVNPETANQAIVWTSENEEVATVENGVVTALKAGTAIIKATSAKDETKFATCEVTVSAQPRLEGLTALLGCDQTTVNVGDEIDVKLYVDSDNAEETYNAFKFGVNFSENLEYLGFTGLDTENDYNFVDAADHTVTVSGFGASKTVSGENALVTLRFKATASGDAKITLPEDAAFANEKNVAVSENLQAIKVVNGEVTVKVVKTFEIPVTGGTVDGGKTVIPATEGESASFTPDQPEDGTVIDKVLVDGEEVSPNPDGSYTIPNPTENTTVTIVTRKLTYSVTFTGNGAADANGAKTAAHGEDYKFTINKDADYNYTVTATIAGKDVAVTGEYTISGADVTGDITIVITKTEKSEEETMRSVTAYLNDSTEGKEMAKVSKNAQNYVFSNPYTQTAKAIRATVKGAEVAITANDDGTWTIPGTFAGDVEIYFAGVYSVTKPEAITGEATAEYDKDYTFTVPAAYATGKPTATIGGEAYALSAGTADENGNIVYTISGKDIKGDIVISLPDPTALVEVNLYFKAEDANGEARNVYIVTAKPNLPMPEGKVFAYNGEAMFWSEEYQAYAYLVSTGEALTAETATAQVALAAGTAQTIDYSGDVNMSGKVDLNDAQLVYDLYNASYYDFSTVSMEKMLRADVSKDKKIDVSDVTAIVAIVRK